jgi:hypothetical protein
MTVSARTGRRRAAQAWLAAFYAVVCAVVLNTYADAQSAPASLLGTWRIARILPTHNSACWDETRAKSLVGTLLTYQPHALLWSGGRETVTETLTRTLTAQQFLDESADRGTQTPIALKDLGIASASVVELDLQHEDADVTGATTEVPGDTVLLAGPGRIVVSACGVYYSAVRAGWAIIARPEPGAR